MYWLYLYRLVWYCTARDNFAQGCPLHINLLQRRSAAYCCSATLLASVLALAGCAVGPDYRRPPAPGVDRYTAQPLPTTTGASSDGASDAQRFQQGHDVPARWWTQFGNPELIRRVDRALAHSPSIASAQAALRQAEENARAAGGAQWPALDAAVGATRQKQSAASFGGAFKFPPLTVYNASVSVGYGLDLFGGTRRAIEGQEALADVQRAQLAATRNQLATYLGTTPTQLQLAPLELDAVKLPTDIPVSLPSRLVEQRPDIRAASAQLHAATAQVGVATAAMLPQITLSASGGS